MALTETPLPTGRIYGVDLIGASLGCLAAVALLELLDPSTVCLVIGALAATAAVAFSVGSNGSVPKPAGGMALALVVLAAANALAYPDLIWISRMNQWPVPTEGLVVDRWNSHSRVVAWEVGTTSPHFWGQGATSRAADTLPEVEVVGIQIGGAAYTAATGFDGDPETLDFYLGASTDDRPFFFNMLKLSAWRDVPDESFGVGVVAGNLRATQTLVGLLRIVVVLAGLTILGPLLMRGRRHGLRTPTFLAASSYFSLIGLGFMLVEIGLMQKFSILLGHPLHSLAITLMSMILASGLGSLAADRIALASPGRLGLLPALAALLIAAGATAIQSAIDLTIGASLPWRAVTVVVFTFPIGFVLGFFFPLGLKRLRHDSPVAQSWMWGMNGAFGVLGGLASIVISMSFGIRTCLLIGAACYLLLSLPAHHLHGRARTGQDS